MEVKNNTGEKDIEIVELYKKGNEAVLKTLFDRYISPLYNFVSRIANKNDAADIVQETFIKVWKNIGSFDPRKASFKTWIFTISRNTATDFLRKKKSILFSDLDNSSQSDEGSYNNSFVENIPDESLLPPESLQKIQDKEFLNKVLENLSAQSREILALHYQEEMTFAEIGEILEQPLNTVKSKHRRAILELRKNLEEN
ncbi:MAG: RNA polymerase sigma factor [Candidatus Paceibacterota bacterium]